MLRAAVIGCGSMGRHHARIYNAMPDVELVALVDPESAPHTQASEYHVPLFHSVQEMLNKIGVPDIASIAAPTSQHSWLAEMCIGKGIHVLVEKPIADTVGRAESMCECAKAAGVILAVGHIERFNPALVELQRELSKGPGVVFRAAFQRFSPFPTRMMGTGVTLDLGIHDIDTALTMFPNDKLERVYGETQSELSADGKDDVFHGTLRFMGTPIVTIDCNWITPKKVRKLTVLCSRGLYECDLLSQELWFHENDSHIGNWEEQSILQGVTEGNSHGFRIKREEPLKLELEDFVHAVKNKHEPVVTGESAAQTLRVAHLLLQSALEGRAINL